MQQAQLAYELGIGRTVNEISLLEQRKIIEDSLLKQIADVLQVSVAAIKNFEGGKHIYVLRNFRAPAKKLRFSVVVSPSDN